MTKTSRVVSSLVPTLASLAVIGVAIGIAVTLTGCGDDPAVVGPPLVDAGLPPGPALYAVHSELDLADNLPGRVGSAAAELIAATDGPDDPTRYLVDRILAKMADGTAKNIAEAAEPFVCAYVNQRLLADAPQLLTRLVQLGDDFGQAARRLGTMDTLEVMPDGTATHAIVGVHVVLDGQVTELGFVDHAMAPVSVAATTHVAGGQLTIDRHALPLSLGGTLRLVLDGAIVPHLDPGAVDLIGLFENSVDCVGFGSAMAESLGFGSATGYAEACRDVLADAATSIYAELEATDADALELDVAGAAHVTASGLTDGRWTGTVSYAGAAAPLASGTFTGARVN